MYYLARTQMLSNYSYPDSLKLASKLGYDGVEISVLDSNFTVRNDFFEKGVINKLKSEVDKMKVVSVSCHLDYVNSDQNLNIIIQAFAVARELGADIFIINGALSSAKNKEEKKKEWQKMIARTSYLSLEAEKKGIRLAKEFEPNFITGNTEQLLKVFKEVDSSNLYANIDIGHVFLCDSKPMQSLKKLQGKIIHGHIENMKKNIHDHLLPYQGDMDLKLYIKQLDNIGFNGPLALDLYKYNYKDVSEKCLKYLRSLKR